MSTALANVTVQSLDLPSMFRVRERTFGSFVVLAPPADNARGDAGNRGDSAFRMFARPVRSELVRSILPAPRSSSPRCAKRARRRVPASSPAPLARTGTSLRDECTRTGASRSA